MSECCMLTGRSFDLFLSTTALYDNDNFDKHTHTHKQGILLTNKYEGKCLKFVWL